MKNRIITSAIYLIFGLLIILIPTVIFPVCESMDMKMACYYTKQAEIGLGAAVALLGIVNAFFGDSKARAGISIGIAAIAPLVFLYPSSLIGVCKMDTMACRLGTEPALTVASILLIVVALSNAIYLLVFKDRSKT